MSALVGHRVKMHFLESLSDLQLKRQKPKS